MVFAVNPPKTGDTIEAFVANAMKASSTPAYTVAIPEAVRATGSGVGEFLANRYNVLRDVLR